MDLEVENKDEYGFFDDNDINDDDRRKKVKNAFFIACKNGDVELYKKIRNLEELSMNDKDESGWTGIVWAIINGHKDIVKMILLSTIKFSSKTYEILNDKSLGGLQEKKVEEANDAMFEVPLEDIFKKPTNPITFGKYTNLHWAAYKGNVIICSLLIKHGDKKPVDMALEIDMYGNTALHQAASSNSFDMFLLFMGLGMDLEVKNSRYHTAADLTSNKDIKEILNKAINTKNCNLCNRQFKFHIHQYVCKICLKIIDEKCCISEYYYETIDAPEKDLLECRCKECYNAIKTHENALTEAIRSNVLESIVIESDKIKADPKIKIDIKLFQESEREILRLRTEKKINQYVDSLQHVENHKTIIKSVSVLEDLIENSKNQNILIDQNVIDKVNGNRRRLLAEKELRQISNNLTVDQSSPENLELIEDKIKNAIETNVEEKYIETAKVVANGISKNLKAKKALQMLVDYPFREFPPEPQIDPKTKKPIKLPDPPKGKKKKKEPPVIIPVEFTEINDLVAKIKEVLDFTKEINDIGLTDEYVKAAKEQIDRMNKEVRFRREEEAKRKEEEEKKKKAKGAPKK